MTALASPALGSTEDATELVPGDANAVDSFAQEIKDWADKISTTGDDLRLVRASEWQGKTADEFESAFAEVPGLWFTASDLLAECARSLETFADAIRSAQDGAQQAIDAWKLAEAATDESRAEYDHALGVYEANRLAHPFHAGQRPLFWDGGGAKRAEAEDILDDARKALETAGDEALMALVRSGGGTRTQGTNDVWGSETSWSWGSVTSDQWKKQWGSAGWAGLDGAPTLGLSAVVASAHASAWVWRAQGSVEKPMGPNNGMLSAQGKATAFSATADGSVSVSDTGFDANAKAMAEVVSASGSVGYTTDYSTTEISGDAGVGVYGDAKGTVHAEGIDFEAEVLAGVKGGVEGSSSVGGIGLTGQAEAWAGAGAGAHGTFAFDDGKLTISAHAGLAWGVGGSLGAGVTLDFEEMGRTASNVWDSMSGWF